MIERRRTYLPTSKHPSSRAGHLKFISTKGYVRDQYNILCTIKPYNPREKKANGQLIDKFVWLGVVSCDFRKNWKTRLLVLASLDKKNTVKQR